MNYVTFEAVCLHSSSSVSPDLVNSVTCFWNIEIPGVACAPRPPHCGRPWLYIWIILDCKLNQFASKIRVIRTVRGLVTLDECREHCIDAEKCSYFKFKVAYLHFSIIFFCCWDYLTSQDHHDVYRRKCTLIQMVVKIRQGWVSGPKFCGRDGRYHRKF